METAYFTFGFSHIHRLNGETIDHNIVVKITSECPRTTAFELFGDKFAFQYAKADDDFMKHFPRGIYEYVG